MSEHKYLTPDETEYIRHHSVRFGWTTEGDTKRLIDDISALRAELKAAQEENRKNLELWDADAKDKDAEIARLRQCAKYESDVAAQAVTELNRLRTALEDAPHGKECLLLLTEHWLEPSPCSCWKSRALNPQPAQPALPALARQMWPLLNRERGVLISRQVDGSITEEEARRLHDLQDFADRWVEAVAPRVEINPQPAQPEKQAEPSDLPALIELARDYVQKMSPEDRAEARRLSAISFAFGNASIHNPNVTYAMVEKAYDKAFPEKEK